MKTKDIYLVAKYSAHPRKKHATAQPGYMKNPGNIKWDEELLVTHGLKNKDFLSARIVLNISQGRVERNSFQNDKTFEELFNYFYSNNKDELNQRFQMYGLSVETKEKDGLQENVSREAEAGTGSEPSATADAVGPSEGPTLDEGITGTTRNDPIEDDS